MGRQGIHIENKVWGQTHLVVKASLCWMRIGYVFMVCLQNQWSYPVNWYINNYLNSSSSNWDDHHIFKVICSEYLVPTAHDTNMTHTFFTVWILHHKKTQRFVTHSFANMCMEVKSVIVNALLHFPLSSSHTRKSHLVHALPLIRLRNVCMDFIDIGCRLCSLFSKLESHL